MANAFTTHSSVFVPFFFFFGGGGAVFFCIVDVLLDNVYYLMVAFFLAMPLCGKKFGNLTLIGNWMTNRSKERYGGNAMKGSKFN